MKTLTLLGVTLVALAGLVGCTTTQPPNAGAGAGIVLSPQDEAAVRAMVAEFANAWNHDDMKGMRELLAEDVLWILGNGNVWRGKEEVYRFYGIYSGKGPSNPLRIEKMEVRCLAPQVAVATAKIWHGPEISELHRLDSFVMAKSGGAWKIVHFHSTVINPDVAKHDRPDFGVTR